MTALRTFVDLFSEGGPFVAAAEGQFRAWPGAPGWTAAIADVAAPGGVHAYEGRSWLFFEPEDSGPIQVGWTDRSLVLLRWQVGGTAVTVGAMSDEERARFAEDVEAALGSLDGVEELGVLDVDDGLVVVAWAAIGGARLRESRAEVDAIAKGSPPAALRFSGGGPALTAGRLPPGSYRIRGAFDLYDEATNRSLTFVRLDPS